MPKLIRPFLASIFVTVVVCFGLAHSAFGSTTLTAEIVSWQVIGLDSNAPASSEPELFMVQAKVTNSGAEAANFAEATLTLGSPTPTDCGGPCIFLVSAATYELGTIAPGETKDAFWTVRIVKSSAALGTETPIVVTVSASNAAPAVATQSARTRLCAPDTAGGILRVEGLISQNRNTVLSYTVSPGTQRPDGSWEVVVGSDFQVTVLAHTATTFDEISVPAIVDPEGTITPVSASFTYESGGTQTDIYALNAGGEVTSVYGYRASTVGDVTLSQLIYDCSGGSYHYNADYRVNTVTIHVVPAPATPVMTLTKTSSPAHAVDPGGQVTFTIVYRNTGTGTATNYVVTDQVDPSLSAITVLNGGTYDAVSRTITWNVGTVAGGASGQVSFTAVVSGEAAGAKIRNVANADSAETNPITSNLVTLTVRQTLPATGAPLPLLLILGLACIGFGRSLLLENHSLHVR